jgi:maltose-binding protein MalE
MRTKLTIAVATAAVAVGAIAAAGAGATASSTTAAKAPTAASTAATRHVEGRVSAIDRSARTFTVRDAERGTLKVKVTSATKFERVTFSSLRTGTRVDVRAKRVVGAWNATNVERGEVGDDHDANHDAGDDHGGDDDGGRHSGGGDDGPNHS